MGRRQELQEELEFIVGSPNVYFQPPQNVTIKHPCIIYQLDDVTTRHANNLPYKQDTQYQITIIDKDPESIIVDKVKKLPRCDFERFFISTNLNHTVFNLYY